MTRVRFPLPRPGSGWLRLGLALLLASCASVDPGPFGEFAASLRALREATDAQAAADVAANRQRLIDELNNNEDLSPADLQLDFPTEFGVGYSFAGQGEPLFVRLLRFQRGLGALNDAMIGYADLLAMLAGDAVVSQAGFDRMTRDLNANAATAAAALRLDLAPDRQALISTAAVRLFQAYVEKRRRAGLQEAVTEVQPQVEAFARAAQTAVRFIATGVKTTYTDDLFPPLALAGDIEGLLALNETTQATLATLGALWSSYGRLPAAHADLAGAAARRVRGLEGLLAFTNEAMRLQGLVVSLTAANVAAADGS